MRVSPEVNARVVNTAHPCYFRSPTSEVKAGEWRAYIVSASFSVARPEGARVRIACGLNRLHDTAKKQTSSMFVCARDEIPLSGGEWTGATAIAGVAWANSPGKDSVEVDVPQGDSFFQFVFFDCDQNTAPPGQSETPGNPDKDVPVTQGWGMIEYINGTSGTAFDLNYAWGYDSETGNSVMDTWTVLRLVELTLAGGLDIHQDNGSGVYPTPHWIAGASSGNPDPLQPSPYLYAAVPGKNTLKITNVKWISTGAPIEGTVTIRAFGTDNCNIAATSGSLDEASLVAPTGGGELTASVPFLTQTKFYRPFTLRWEISFTTYDNVPIWEDAGTTQHPIYVCLKGPEGAQIPYRTVVHLACANDGATTPDQAVEKSWEFFTSLDIKAWNEGAKCFDRELYYYKPWTHFDENVLTIVPNERSLGSQRLLQQPNASGRCGTWACFLGDVLWLNANGEYIQTIYIEIDAPPNAPAVGFLVRDWQYNNPNATSGILIFPENSNDMEPHPFNFVYGSLTSNYISKQGQNSLPNSPSQKCFDEHVIIKYKSRYLDPSYGIEIYGKEDISSKEIFAYAESERVIRGKLHWKLKERMDAPIKFTPHSFPY